MTDDNGMDTTPAQSDMELFEQTLQLFPIEYRRVEFMETFEIQMTYDKYEVCFVFKKTARSSGSFDFMYVTSDV